MTDWGENPRAAYLEAQQRIAELEEQNFNLSEKLRVITNEGTEYCVAYNQGWEVGNRKGMERAAEIVREHGLFAEEHIRKEIGSE